MSIKLLRFSVLSVFHLTMDISLGSFNCSVNSFPNMSKVQYTSVLPWHTCIAPCNPLYIRSVSIQHKKPKLQAGLSTVAPTLHCLVSSPSWKGKVIEEWESKPGSRCWLGNRPAWYALLALPGSVVCSQYLVTSVQISGCGHHWLSLGHLYVRKAVLQTSPIQTELHR